MARYDRHYDYGLRGMDDTPRRDARFGGGRGRPGGGYDAPFRGGGGGSEGYAAGAGYDYGYRGAPPMHTPRVTARYNRDYVFPREERPVNYNSYGGSPELRVGDYTEFQRPYQTISGTRTSRGMGPVGWERAYSRYGRDYGGY